MPVQVCVRLSTVAAALAFLAIPTIASAHGGNNDPNTVHVCIGNVSKVVRSVGVGGACISAPPLLAETADHWQKQGIAGPQGDKGDQGIQGIPGPQGQPGTNGTNGTDGANGTNGVDGTSVTFVGYVLPGDATCPNGGAVYAAGNVNAYVCNGQNGTMGSRRDPPCFHNFNRYANCGNGTVTDTVTGLIWLQDAACAALGNPPGDAFGGLDWAAANRAAGALKNGDCGLTDGSSPGDWRLPTSDEWIETMSRAAALRCSQDSNDPELTNEKGTGCFPHNGQFAGVARPGYYWSSNSSETFPFEAWFTLLHDGSIESSDKTFTLRVWPVRGGSR
jgi:hypothetical protein